MVDSGCWRALLIALEFVTALHAIEEITRRNCGLLDVSVYFVAAVRALQIQHSPGRRCTLCYPALHHGNGFSVHVQEYYRTLLSSLAIARVPVPLIESVPQDTLPLQLALCSGKAYVRGFLLRA